MSIYHDLNDVHLELEQYEHLLLSESEKRAWEKRVLKKLRNQRPSHKKVYLGATAALAIILAVSISFGSGMVSVANMPFVGGMIEEYIDSIEPSDYAPFKTTIGTIAQNAYGKLTLNEVLIDGGRLLISSTFEPAESVEFNYRMHPIPDVLINGENQTLSIGGQSVELNDSMYTIYNDAEIKDIPLGEIIHIEITYDKLDVAMPIENPWVFNIEVSTEQIASTTETIHFNRNIKLGNGQSIHLEKMIVTPISTVIYYDWPEQAHHIAFKIVSESGKELEPNSAAIDPEQAYNRYTSIDLQRERYYLVPIEVSEHPNVEELGSILELRIPVNP